MKKALFALSTAATSIALAAAQFSGTITIGGNGGSITVGQQAQGGQVTEISFSSCLHLLRPSSITSCHS